MSKLPLPTLPNREKPKRGLSGWASATAAVVLLATGYYYGCRTRSANVLTPFSPVPLSGNLQQCAIENLLGTGLPFLKDVSPIALVDFEERRDRLANALVAEDVDAFVVEPGYTFKYYGNVSQPEWEVWEVWLFYPGGEIAILNLYVARRTPILDGHPPTA
jgi:hypothetical protein